MTVKTKSGLSFEFSPTSDEGILKIDSLLGKS